VRISRIGGHYSADRTRAYVGLTIKNIGDAADADDAEEWLRPQRPRTRPL